ncbi:VOC family protein [Arthrobacter sp. JSM 101049]|uniref:VOC family protein n=1 Tax=Arthrobacter sp. JSM 101049 TaxID=929097 RepID=UPI003566AE91
MTATFNHTIIAALDRTASARLYLDLLEATETVFWGPFTNIMLEAGVMLQLAEPPMDIQMQHYAFLVDDDHFDRALALRGERGIEYWADPQLQLNGRTNTENGGRGFYVQDPAGHGIELITRPYL